MRTAVSRPYKAAKEDMNDISLPDFHLRFVDNLESVSLEQHEVLQSDDEDPFLMALAQEPRAAPPATWPALGCRSGHSDLDILDMLSNHEELLLVNYQSLNMLIIMFVYITPYVNTENTEVVGLILRLGGPARAPSSSSDRFTPAPDHDEEPVRTAKGVCKVLKASKRIGLRGWLKVVRYVRLRHHCASNSL